MSILCAEKGAISVEHCRVNGGIALEHCSSLLHGRFARASVLVTRMVGTKSRNPPENGRSFLFTDGKPIFAQVWRVIRRDLGQAPRLSLVNCQGDVRKKTI